MLSWLRDFIFSSGDSWNRTSIAMMQTQRNATILYPLINLLNVYDGYNSILMIILYHIYIIRDKRLTTQRGLNIIRITVLILSSVDQ